FFAAFIYCYFLKRTYVYTITNRRCDFSGGILRHVRHSVPYHKITDVEMSQNIIERMLGISSLGIYTPGTGSMNSGGSGRRPEIAYVGLKDNETPAEMINSILSNFKATGE
nr:PH domain-containing protein [Planctomycetota bacterium]